jgi:hypothetical protein
LRVAIEKLRGFIADHHADVVTVERNLVTLEVVDGDQSRNRRTNDRSACMVVELRFSEEESNTQARDGAETTANQWTRIDVNMRAKPSRNRRKESVVEPARRIATSLRAYLMVNEYDRTGEPVAPREDHSSLLRVLLKK